MSSGAIPRSQRRIVCSSSAHRRTTNTIRRMVPRPMYGEAFTAPAQWSIRTTSVVKRPLCVDEGGCNFSRPNSESKREIAAKAPVRDNGELLTADCTALLLSLGQRRMLTARAMTRAANMSERADCTIIATFAHFDIGITSVGLNAVAFVNDV